MQKKSVIFVVFVVVNAKMNSVRYRNAENMRKSHITKIYLHNSILVENKLKDLGLIETENKMAELKKVFADFTEQHTLMAAETVQENRESHESFFVVIERIYQKVFQAYNRHIDHLTRQRYIEMSSITQTHLQELQADLTHSRERERNRSRSPIPIAVQVGRTQTHEQIHSQVVRPANDLRYRLESGVKRIQRIPRAELHPKRTLKCNYCQGPHPMFACSDFLRLPIEVRKTEVEELKLCSNCLMPKKEGEHRCRFGSCRRCGKNEYHNSVLCEKGYY